MQKFTFHIETFKYTDDEKEDDIENQTSGEPEIKNADPYYNKPYDTILRAQAILDKLINDFINFEALDERKLKTQLLRDEIIRVCKDANDLYPIAETGIFKKIDFSKRGVTDICRETLLLINGMRNSEILKIYTNDIKIEDYFIGTGKIYFYIARKIYINIGKLYALHAYFEDKYQSNKEQEKKESSSTAYLPLVKETLLKLLQKQGRKENTLPKVLEGIKDQFEKEYTNIQKTPFDCTQKFFDMKNLVRNIHQWRKDDPDFKEAISEFLK